MTTRFVHYFISTRFLARNLLGDEIVLHKTFVPLKHFQYKTKFVQQQQIFTSLLQVGNFSLESDIHLLMYRSSKSIHKEISYQTNQIHSGFRDQWIWHVMKLLETVFKRKIAEIIAKPVMRFSAKVCSSFNMEYILLRLKINTFGLCALFQKIRCLRWSLCICLHLCVSDCACMNVYISAKHSVGVCVNVCVLVCDYVFVCAYLGEIGNCVCW